MLKFVVTYITSLLTFWTSAQTIDTFKISGVVVSTSNNKPIPDGFIMLTKTSGYRCDSLGQFSVYGLSKGEHKLTFSAFGYPTIDTIIVIGDGDIENLRWAINSTCNGRYNNQQALEDIKKGKPIC